MLLLLLSACAPPAGKPGPVDVDDTDTAADDTGTLVAPGADFDGLCRGAAWDTTLTPGVVPETSSTYAGYLTGHADYKRGTVESSKIIPTHPFHVRKVRMRFADGMGTARMRLMNTFGRSYPAGYPDLDAEGANVMTPVDVEVDTVTNGREWVEVDVADQGVFLLPTQHYAIVNEYPTKGAPTVGFAHTPTGESSRALLILPDEDTPYGLDGNFQMELEGDYFCTWAEADRQFGVMEIPFGDDAAGNGAITDLDGDSHVDIVTYGAGPRAWRGDGAGGFTEFADPWPEVTYATWLLFGDVDNDGDADAFAASYVTADADGDGVTLAAGDCNDADATVLPGAEETTNGRDDDCDGVSDDGTDTTDADADNHSIADGDCDDTREDTSPDVAEVLDSRDNDCDGLVDEDYPSRLLLNDGMGSFTALSGAGVEVTEPSTAGDFGDADEDGFLDLYFGNWLEHYPDDDAVQDRYYVGVGDGTFVDARDAAGLTLPTAFSVYGVQWTDWNNDGHADISVATYHLYDDQLWANQGDGTFVDVAATVAVDHDQELSPYAQYPGGHGYGGDFGDFDNDGDMDLFQSNLSHPRTQPWADTSTFNVNQGGPDFTFVDLRDELGFVYDEGDVNAQFADYDNDMDLDIVVSSLYPTHYARLYRNEGGVSFTDVTYEAGVHIENTFAVIWADVDEDGDEDLYVGDGAGAPYQNLFENRVGQDNHWTDIVLEGVTTNRDGAGARVTLDAGGVTQLRDIQDGNGSFNTQRPRVAHFGLAANTAVDSVTVRWIGGATETFTGVGVDGTFLLVEGTGVAGSR